jgi:hypothetical protein
MTGRPRQRPCQPVSTIKRERERERENVYDQSSSNASYTPNRSVSVSVLLICLTQLLRTSTYQLVDHNVAIRHLLRGVDVLNRAKHQHVIEHSSDLATIELGLAHQAVKVQRLGIALFELIAQKVLDSLCVAFSARRLVGLLRCCLQIDRLCQRSNVVVGHQANVVQHWSRWLVRCAIEWKVQLGFNCRLEWRTTNTVYNNNANINSCEPLKYNTQELLAQFSTLIHVESTCWQCLSTHGLCVGNVTSRRKVDGGCNDSRKHLRQSCIEWRADRVRWRHKQVMLANIALHTKHSTLGRWCHFKLPEHYAHPEALEISLPSTQYRECLLCTHTSRIVGVASARFSSIVLLDRNVAASRRTCTSRVIFRFLGASTATRAVAAAGVAAGSNRIARSLVATLDGGSERANEIRGVPGMSSAPRAKSLLCHRHQELFDDHVGVGW